MKDIDSRRSLIVERKAVCIWTHLLYVLAVFARLTDIRAVISACAAICRFIVPRTSREAGVEDWSLDFVVRIGVDAIAWICWTIVLEIPGTPSQDVIFGLTLFQRYWVGGVGARISILSGARIFKKRDRSDADGIGQVWWNLFQ